MSVKTGVGAEILSAFEQWHAGAGDLNKFVRCSPLYIDVKEVG